MVVLNLMFTGTVFTRWHPKAAKHSMGRHTGSENLNGEDDVVC